MRHLRPLATVSPLIPPLGERANPTRPSPRSLLSRVRVAPNLPRTIPHALVYVQSILPALKGNPAFPTVAREGVSDWSDVVPLLVG